jgi:hypothetical protein
VNSFDFHNDDHSDHEDDHSDHGDDHSDHRGNHDRDPIPEPATIALLGTALLGFGVIRRRKA